MSVRLPPTTVVMVGAPGVVRRVAVSTVLYAPAPASLTAATRNETGVPLASEVTAYVGLVEAVSATTVVHVVASVELSTG